MLFFTLLALTIHDTFAFSIASRARDFSSGENGTIEAFTSRTYSLVGGEYLFDPILNGTVKIGQMYVEKLTPQLRGSVKTKEVPIVFIHGSGQTGSVSLWATADRILQQSE
jgi:hypothetical protein